MITNGNQKNKEKNDEILLSVQTRRMKQVEATSVNNESVHFIKPVKRKLSSEKENIKPLKMAKLNDKNKNANEKGSVNNTHLNNRYLNNKHLNNKHLNNKHLNNKNLNNKYINKKNPSKVSHLTKRIIDKNNTKCGIITNCNSKKMNFKHLNGRNLNFKNLNISNCNSKYGKMKNSNTNSYVKSVTKNNESVNSQTLYRNGKMHLKVKKEKRDIDKEGGRKEEEEEGEEGEEEREEEGKKGEGEEEEDEEEEDEEEETYSEKTSDEEEENEEETEYVLTHNIVKEAIEMHVKEIGFGLSMSQSTTYSQSPSPSQSNTKQEIEDETEEDLFHNQKKRGVIRLYSDIMRRENDYHLASGMRKIKVQTLKNKNSKEEYISCYFYLFGLVTMYSFYTFRKNRNRISQFLIFPQMQNKGMGLIVLEKIYYLSIFSKKINEIAVEDPAPSFMSLRDIVVLKICFDMGLLSPTLLYPQNYLDMKKLRYIEKEKKREKEKEKRDEKKKRKKIENIKEEDEKVEDKKSEEKEQCKEKEEIEKEQCKEKEEIEKENETENIETQEIEKRTLALLCKESQKQISRICEIIQLAGTLPHPMHTYDENKNAKNEINKTIQVDVGTNGDIDMNVGTSAIFDSSTTIGHHINNSNINADDDTTNYNGIDSINGNRECALRKKCRGLQLMDSSFDASESCKSVRIKVKEDLSRQWHPQYHYYYRTIQKLRNLYPL